MSQNPFRFFSPRDAGYTPGFENHAIDLAGVLKIEINADDISFMNSYGLTVDYVSITGVPAAALHEAALKQLADFLAWAVEHGEVCGLAPTVLAAQPAAMPAPVSTATGSVRIMRSHDYCHFEVTLEPSGPLTITGFDSMRKDCARLVDKAVEQYKKKKDALAMEDSYTTRDLRAAVKDIQQRPESEWTPEEKATVKELGDREHAARYDYEDNPEDDQALGYQVLASKLTPDPSPAPVAPAVVADPEPNIPY